MLHFTPSLNVFETASNITTFIKTNKQVFWDILNPLLPYIIALTLLDFLVVSVFFMNDPHAKFELGAFLANYFLFALVISWHRVVIHGPGNYTPVNPLKPTRNELIFIGMAMLASVLTVIVTATLGLTLSILGSFGVFIGVCTGIFLGIYLTYKIMFYFPARAANTPITLKESFNLTHGFFWKIAGTGILASLKTLVILIVYFVAVGLFGAGLFSVLNNAGGGMHFIANIFTFVIKLPVMIYFQPILTVIGVTILSNYYLWAIQHNDQR